MQNYFTQTMIASVEYPKNLSLGGSNTRNIPTDYILYARSVTNAEFAVQFFCIFVSPNNT